MDIRKDSQTRNMQETFGHLLHVEKVIMKYILKYCKKDLKKEWWGRGQERVKEGMNIIRVYYMYVWKVTMKPFTLNN
jgi:hypothetical protein